MLDGFLREKLFDLLIWAEELQRGLYNAVEEESKVDKQRETHDLEPLEGFPAQTERDDPNEQGTAAIDSRAGCGANTAGDGETKEVEASDEIVRICILEVE